MFLRAMRAVREYRPDLVQRATNFATTTSFQLLAKTKDPAQMTGAMRVAYGPLERPPLLDAPTVMVPGFAMEAASFDRFAQHLATEPANGPVTVFVTGENQFRDGSANGRVLTASEVKKRKIISVQYEDPFNGPSVKAPSLTEFMRLVGQMTRAKEVDCFSHSEGGTDLRLYLNEREKNPKGLPAIRNFTMIGPATRGTLLGNVGAVVGVVKNASVAASELSVGSELTQSLLDKWPAHRKQITGQVKVITMTGVPTLTPGGPLGVRVTSGDGFMPYDSVKLQGAKTVLLQGPHSTLAAHLYEPQYSGVINESMKSLRPKRTR